MPNSLEGVLSRLPGYSGYIAKRRYDEQSQLGELQQAGGAMSLIDILRKQKQEGQFRSELEALGPNPTQESLAGVAAKYSAPGDIMKTQQSSLDRQATVAATKEATAGRLQQASQALDLKQQDLERKREEFTQRTTDQNSRTVFEQWYKNQTLQNKAQQDMIQNELRKQGLDIQRQGLEVQRGLKSVQQTSQLQSALEKANLPETNAVLEAVEKALEKTPQLADYMTSKALTPDLLVSKDIAVGRQAAQKLMNITLKDRSGAAVTNPEFERLKQEFATGIWKKPEQFKAGVKQARDIITKHYQSVAAGFGPEVLKQYNENLKSFGGKPVLEAEDPLGIR